MTDNDNIRAQMRDGERIITEGDSVPTTPPFGDAPQPDPYGNDAERMQHLSNEVQRLERELDETRMDLKSVRYILRDVHEMLAGGFPQEVRDLYPANDINDTPGMAQRAIQAVTDLHRERNEARQDAIAAEVAYDALQQDVIYIVSMLSELDDIAQMGTQETISGALELVRLMARRTLRDDPAITPPDDADEISF
jgi:hypothetical protein